MDKPSLTLNYFQIVFREHEFTPEQLKKTRHLLDLVLEDEGATVEYIFQGNTKDE